MRSGKKETSRPWRKSRCSFRRYSQRLLTRHHAPDEQPFLYPKFSLKDAAEHDTQCFRGCWNAPLAVIRAANAIDAGGTYTHPPDVRKTIIEGAVLKDFVAWETLLEESFTAFLLGRPRLTEPYGRNTPRRAILMPDKFSKVCRHLQTGALRTRS